MKSYEVRVSDEGSSCTFTITDGKLASVSHSGGIPVEKVLSGADLAGDHEDVKDAVETAFNANGSEYEATVEEV